MLRAACQYLVSAPSLFTSPRRSIPLFSPSSCGHADERACRVFNLRVAPRASAVTKPRVASDQRGRAEAEELCAARVRVVLAWAQAAPAARETGGDGSPQECRVHAERPAEQLGSSADQQYPYLEARRALLAWASCPDVPAADSLCCRDAPDAPPSPPPSDVEGPVDGEWVKELAAELTDQLQLGRRGEAWFAAQVAAFLLVVFPPEGLRPLVDLLCWGGALAGLALA